MAGEEQGQQDDRAEIGDRGSCDHELTKRRADRCSESFNTGTITPSEVSREHDRDEQRRLDEPTGMKREADDDPDRERKHEPERR